MELLEHLDTDFGINRTDSLAVALITTHEHTLSRHAEANSSSSDGHTSPAPKRSRHQRVSQILLRVVNQVTK